MEARNQKNCRGSWPHSLNTGLGKENICRQRKLPTSIKEKGKHWLRRVVSPLHREAARQKCEWGSGAFLEPSGSRIWL
eukprot:67193-Pelagomonas_calceolata.AAC.1